LLVLTHLIMQFKSPEDFHNKLGFIFHALLAVPLAAFVYLFLEIKNREFEPAISIGINPPVIIAMLLILTLVIVGFGYYSYRKNIKKAQVADDGLKGKLSAYFNYLVTLYAFIEGGSLLLIAGLYLTTSSFFIVGYMFLLLVLSLNRPTPQKYVGDLRLQGEERDVILHKKPFESIEN